jgi:hypothetical protein
MLPLFVGLFYQAGPSLIAIEVVPTAKTNGGLSTYHSAQKSGTNSQLEKLLFS